MFIFLLFLIPSFAKGLGLATADMTAVSNISWPPTPGALPEYKCVNRPSWSVNRYWQDGCPRAWHYARSVEAWQASTKLEFLPNNERPEARRRRRMDTPRRYNMGGCTVAIVMVSFFNPEDLPGQPPARTRYSHSVTTFNNIWRAGQYVFENCLVYGRPSEPGWNNAGFRHSVGIFFWATNSEMDIRISHGPWRGPQFNASLETWNTASTVDTA